MISINRRRDIIYVHCIELPQDGILESLNVKNDSIESCHRLMEQLRYVIVFHAAHSQRHQRITLQNTQQENLQPIAL